MSDKVVTFRSKGKERGVVWAGPLAVIDLLLYCRTGILRNIDGRPLTEEQKTLR